MDATLHVVIRAGEESRVELGGPKGAGYAWTWSVQGDADAVRIARVVGRPAGGAAPGGLPPGSGGVVEELSITGVHAGHAVVLLRLARSFAPDRALEERSVEVEVVAG